MHTSIRLALVMIAVSTWHTFSLFAQAEQWNGSQGPNNTIWRSGNVALGFDPGSGGGDAPLFELRRPMSSTRPLLFSVRSTFKDAVSDRFEVDDQHAYAGGARSKSDLLSSDTDFAVHRTAVIGTVGVTEHVPSGYKLIVAGSILAEEVRIKAIKDWADYVFEPTYQMKSLPEIEDFIRVHHHLPDVPTASEVAAQGINLSHMQATLLSKIEELTLHLIDQHRTIAALQDRLAQLPSNHGRAVTPTALTAPTSVQNKRGAQ